MSHRVAKDSLTGSGVPVAGVTRQEGACQSRPKTVAKAASHPHCSVISLTTSSLYRKCNLWSVIIPLFATIFTAHVNLMS